MTDKIKVITQPDHVLDRERSLLAVCPSADLKKSLEEYVSNLDYPVNLYIYSKEDDNIRWLLTTVNIVDTILLDIDNCTGDANHFISYILSYSNTYYRCEHMLAPWELINLNRFYDFPNI